MSVVLLALTNCSKTYSKILGIYANHAIPVKCEMALPLESVHFVANRNFAGLHGMQEVSGSSLVSGSKPT
jgi:hypothetical protein